MGDSSGLQDITIGDKVLVTDGMIAFTIESMGVWIDPACDFNKARVGYRMHPTLNLEIAVPVTGVKEGEPVSPEQAAQILEAFMASLLPACKVFVTAVSGQFGYREPVVPLEPDF